MSTDLDRYTKAQEESYATVLTELEQASKQTHWMWFIFPQLDGLGHSHMSRRYSLKNLGEAGAYLAHPLLGPRLLDCCRALLNVEGKTAAQIMGYPDDLKLRSSMTLFALTAPSQADFGDVLTKFFGGVHDDRTLQLLGRQA